MHNSRALLCQVILRSLIVSPACSFWAGYVVRQNPQDYVKNGSYVPTKPVIATEFDGGSVTSDGR